MAANFINFVTSLLYGDMGNAELGTSAPPLPAGEQNHLLWTIAKKPSSPTTTVTGNEFLTHHLDYMLARYEAWRSKYFLPLLRPWDGQNVFPSHHGDPPVGPALPATLNGSPFPSGWTLNDLGSAVRAYYNTLRNFSDITSGGTEFRQDEIKAAYSYRYWAFMKWVSDLRKRLNSQPVIPISISYDRDGTILADKEFADVFHQVHHVWHPNSGEPSWTTATPFFKTSVGQHRRKKQISRTQVGAEFFTFHRDHLEVFDRWLERTGQERVQSLNTCAHDTTSVGSPPSGVDADSSGNPKVHWDDLPSNPVVDLNPAHATYWNGDLREFSNLGEMGQLFATDFNPFSPPIAVPGTSDYGYHGEGHVLNGDLIEPVANNYVPRFHAWHGFNDDIWKKRRPDFNTFEPVLETEAPYPQPHILTILRDLISNTDTIEPSNAIQSINLTNGQGTLKIKLNIRQDPFNRSLELKLRCEVIRESISNAAVISVTRDLIITPGVPGNPNERQQNTTFTEQFVFDGSPGTTDSDGQGPFASDNLLFTPTATGFKNSLIRITGYLTCNRKPDGTVPLVSGTISTLGTSLTGSGTLFTNQLRQGDLIRANGEVKMIALIASNTSLTLLDPFSANLAAGTSYERLDGFDFEQTLLLPLIQEKRAPEVAVFLNRSSFSKDQVDAIAVGGQSIFDNSFYIILQDRTTRAGTISWPAEVDPQLHGLIAPPLFASGIYTDLAHAPDVELQDLMNNPVPGLSVTVTAVNLEDTGLHPAIPQRITYTCTVTFTNATVFAGMAAGDTRDLKLVITATDRSGNRTTDDSKRIRLQVNANPYMLDGPTSWLSVDTRVFKIQQGQARFGVASGWIDPNTFIKEVIQNLKSGNGTAGGESFDLLTQDQEESVLEYSTTINGINYYNFALAKMRLQSNSGAANVRASFRLFRWGTANVEFDNTLAYRSALSGIALLGRTTTNELASIPFFAEQRVAVANSMTTQTDPRNEFSFGPTGGGEAITFFGAYLDINQGAPRFPNTYINDGGFAGTLYSIRNLLIGNHQCMVVEVVFASDPTVNGATPGTSDNLSQRNLLIVQTANPGDEITRTIQHPFDIDITRKRVRKHTHNDDDHNHDDHNHLLHSNNNGIHHSNNHNHHLNPDENCCEPVLVLQPTPSRATNNHQNHHADHLKDSWFAQDSKLLEKAIQRRHHALEAQKQWQYDFNEWKAGTGLDELVFYWNNLPEESIVELFLPNISVAEVLNFRNLRHAPSTVKIVDNHTLRLLVKGITYLPIPPFWGDNLAGLITVQLPKGIKKGQRYKVDVLQMRTDEAQVLGGFQLNIQVEKARDLFEKENRILQLFHQRLSLIPVENRWRSVFEKQVAFMRARAKGMVDLANLEDPEQPPIEWKDPTQNQKGQKIKVILEKIQIVNDREPFFKGKGEFRFSAKVATSDNGGLSKEFTIPNHGHYSISDNSGENEIELNIIILDNFVENNLFIQIGGIELDTFDPDDRLNSYKRDFSGKPENWIGNYFPKNGEPSMEDLGDWKIFYRVEYSG